MASNETKSRGTGRTRNYATVVYPESAPPDWLAIAGELKIPCFISPLHDKDLNPTGEQKKPHHHVMIMFEGVKTREQVAEIFDQIGGVGVEVIQSVRGICAIWIIRTRRNIPLITCAVLVVRIIQML